MLFDKREERLLEQGTPVTVLIVEHYSELQKYFNEADLILSSSDKLGNSTVSAVSKQRLFKNHEMRTTITKFLVSSLNMIRT